MNVIIVTQARISSTRFPEKVLKDVNGISMLELHLKRLKRSKLASNVIVATTHEPDAQKIVDIAVKAGCQFYQGSTNDVLDRFYQSLIPFMPDVVVRVTSDCPLNDGHLIDQMLEEFSLSPCEYFSNIHPPTFPDGVDVEIFKFSALRSAWLSATEKKDREHVTPYIWSHPHLFKIGNFVNKIDDSEYRLTVDKPEDLRLVKILTSKLGFDSSWETYLNELKINPELCELNKHNIRNAGF